MVHPVLAHKALRGERASRYPRSMNRLPLAAELRLCLRLCLAFVPFCVQGQARYSGLQCVTEDNSGY